jgi:hypothetical protein
METTTHPIVRPAERARVRVQFPNGETTEGAVLAHYDDGFDIFDSYSGEDWTLFDVEQADARCVVTVL